jgi:hypothetical protein
MTSRIVFHAIKPHSGNQLFVIPELGSVIPCLVAAAVGTASDERSGGLVDAGTGAVFGLRRKLRWTGTVSSDLVENVAV